MSKKPAVGDPVLFYGQQIKIMEIVDQENRKLAKCAEPSALKKREDARKTITALRKEQESAKGQEHEELAQEIARLDADVRAAVFTVSLRVDLLDWWQERSVWVSDGRILSDDQVAVFKAKTGRKPMADAQRQALAAIEGWS